MNVQTVRVNKMNEKMKQMKKTVGAHEKAEMVTILIKMAAVIQDRIKCVDNVLYCDDCPLSALFDGNVDMCLR